MVNKQNEIERVYLRNHDYHQKICEYSLSDGRCRELPRTELKTDLRKGFYVHISLFIGLYSSLEGPVFFINEKRFVLKKGMFSFSICQNGDMESNFTFVMNNIIQFNIVYPKVVQKEYDVWSDEEMVDFFRWLYSNQSDDKFYSYYSEG